jgi:hypothetical protein
VYLLLVLGIGLMGAGTAALGFAAQSIATVGIGAGAMLAAGFISLFGLVRSGLNITDERAQKDPTSQRRDSDPENRRPAWPPKNVARSRTE